MNQAESFINMRSPIFVGCFPFEKPSAELYFLPNDFSFFQSEGTWVRKSSFGKTQ